MTKLFEELNEGMKQAIDVAEGKMPGRITTRSDEEKIIGFTGDTCVERKGKRTSAVDSLTGVLNGKNVSKGLTKQDFRRMTDQELQRLIENAVSELCDRQKAKHAAIYQEAEAALQKNEKDRYSKLCGQMGRVQATEDILKEFLGRF